MRAHYELNMERATNAWNSWNLERFSHIVQDKQIVNCAHELDYTVYTLLQLLNVACCSFRQRKTYSYFVLQHAN